MRATTKLLALALTAALQPAIAGVVPLTFEDITIADNRFGYVELKDRYIKDGIVFSGAAWGQVTSANGCGGVSKITTRDGCTVLAMEGGDSFMLNFSQGFITGTSFNYSALPGADVTITLFEGENGTGARTVLAASLTEALCDDGARFCNWDPLVMRFAGVARSMSVSGADQTLMLDDFSFIQATTEPGRLPEPTSMVLAFSALGALGWARKRAAAR